MQFIGLPPKGEIILNEENLLGDKKLLTSELVGDIDVVDSLIDKLDEISGLAFNCVWTGISFKVPIPSSKVSSQGSSFHQQLFAPSTYIK